MSCLSAADIPSDNPNGIKTLLARDVSTFFINGNQLSLMVKNPPSWLVIFLVVPFNKIPLFSKDLITFIIYFLSSFLELFLIPVTD